MLSLEEVRIDDIFDNAQMPHGVTITHIPTGIQVHGNCKMETSVPNLKNTLLTALGQFVASEQLHRPKKASNGDESAYLHEVIRNMQAQLDALTRATQAPRPDAFTNIERIAKAAKSEKPAKKATRGRAGKRTWSPERRAAYEAAKVAEPEPVLTATSYAGGGLPSGTVLHSAASAEQALIAQQMRPPTDAPTVLPKSHQSKGSTVAVSNVDWIKP